jgi:hypothetical protein
VDPLVTVLSVLGGLLGGIGAVLGVLYARARGARDDLRETVRGEEALKNAADAALHQAQSSLDALGVLRGELHGLHEEITRLDTQGSAGLGAVAVRVSVLESKMDVFWKNVALDVSKILHSPHEGWEDLDRLLERFQETVSGEAADPISPGEMTSLAGTLREIVDGQWAAGSATRADQVAASLLLHAIEQTKDVRRG